jgi:glycosyltransferase involved in cell wall biosynthesis
MAKKEEEKKLQITVGIPAFKAQDHIEDCLSSINIQTVRDIVEVVIASDNPEDNYDYLIEKFPKLTIKTVPCEKNTGPGLARQRALDNATTNWITFIDADDVFMTPFSLEQLAKGIQENVIEVQGPFYQEIRGNPQVRTVTRNDIGHPWVFGRLYNTQFLKQYGIQFSELRAMEDGEFNWKIRMSIEGTQLKINVINDPIYLWRIGSEHSITRIGADDQGIPQYNFDLCQIGATQASIRAIKFCREKNPFNGGISRFATEMMIGHYFTYIECLERKPVFAEQNLFNAKRFYHEAYKEIEHLINDKTLKDMYTMQYAGHSQQLIGIIPQISFNEFFDKVKNDKYDGENELKEIRSKFSKEILDNDKKCGVAIW